MTNSSIHGYTEKANYAETHANSFLVPLASLHRLQNIGKSTAFPPFFLFITLSDFDSKYTDTTRWRWFSDTIPRVKPGYH